MCPEYAQALAEMANLPTWFGELAESLEDDPDLYHAQVLALASGNPEALITRVDSLCSRIKEISSFTIAKASKIRAVFGARTHARKAGRQIWGPSDPLGKDLYEKDEAERAPPLTEVVAQPIVSHAPPAPTALGAASRAA